MKYKIEYNDLNEETKTYINKAIDIFLAIYNKNIVRNVRNLYDTINNYNLTAFDKKILALFIAGFLADGNLKKILSQFDEIKLNDLLNFIDVNQNGIVSNEENYEKLYNEYFKLDLITLIDERYNSVIVNFVTSELIFSSLQYSDLYGSQILDFYAYEHNLGSKVLGFSSHPLFSSLISHLKYSGAINSELSAKNNHTFLADFYDIDKPNPNEQTSKKSADLIDFNDEHIWDLLEDIKAKFIGQEKLCEDLFYNIVNNQQLVDLDELPDGQRSIIFLDGPTGTGKTAITREITEKLGIPFVATSVVNYSSTGYVGADITDTLNELYTKAGYDLEKAQRGIIVFDEFDKIAYSKSGGLEMKKAVQQQLLDFMGGGKYNFRYHNFDTSKLTFVCLGALTELRFNKLKRDFTIGFGSADNSSGQNYTITPQDLVDIGLERELVGRFNTYLHTTDYDKVSLIKILKESKISPLIGFKKWVESKGKSLEIDDAVYELIANQAYELNTGARSLQTIINNIRTKYIREVLRGTSKVVTLNADVVEQINDHIINRKGRN